MTHKEKQKVAKLRHAEYYDMQLVFDEIYEKSRKGQVFDNLIEIIIAPENIMLAYRNIKRNKGSKTAGTDGKTIEAFANMDSSKFVQYVQKQFKQYSPKAVKRVEIPKANGKKRPLGIPCIIDRIIQQCILQVLEPICEARFYKSSYGFRPNRSAEHAIAHCYRLINLSKLNYVVDVDIKGFFDNVNHRKLIRQLWTMGIRDTKVLCIIKAMLRAPIKMPNGVIEWPQKGTPQGGILSPLLANVVLNELDWWIASQWELQYEHMRTPPKPRISESGQRNLGHEYEQLRKTGLKEMYIVRYADDFKVFCPSYDTAKRSFYAIEKWLRERLKLEISPEKSRITNLRKRYCEFLGFRIKVWRKKERFVTKSHICEKALERIKRTLAGEVGDIQRPRNKIDLYRRIGVYNSMVMGIQNYYSMATEVCSDLGRIGWYIGYRMRGRLKVEKQGKWNNLYLHERYGSSKQVRWYQDMPIMPIGYVRCKKAMSMKYGTCSYTPEGRKMIHKNLALPMDIVRWFMRNPVRCRSIEYNDNRISKYIAQYGMCAVTGVPLTPVNGHCHHTKPVKQGGGDEYSNLIWVLDEIHRLIHATNQETMSRYLSVLNLNEKQIKKINKLRKCAGLEAISA